MKTGVMMLALLSMGISGCDYFREDVRETEHGFEIRENVNWPS